MTLRGLSVIGLVVAGVMFVFTALPIFAWSVLAFGAGIVADGLLRESQD